MDLLTDSLREAPVVQRGDYEYFVHPVSDGIPLVEPALLREIAGAIAEAVDVTAADKILTAEAMGIHIATAVSLETDVPFVIARKRSYGFDGEVPVHQETAYGEGELYVNCVEPDDEVLIVDDVCSTGNTLAAMASAVDHIGASVTDIVVVIRRTSDEPLPDLPTPVTSLIDVDVEDGSVVVRETVA